MTAADHPIRPSRRGRALKSLGLTSALAGAVLAAVAFAAPAEADIWWAVGPGNAATCDDAGLDGQIILEGVESAGNEYLSVGLLGGEYPSIYVEYLSGQLTLTGIVVNAPSEFVLFGGDPLLNNALPLIIDSVDSWLVCGFVGTPTSGPTEPTPTATPTESPTPTDTPSETPTASPSPTDSATPTQSPTPTESPSPTETPSPTYSPTPTLSPTLAPTETPTATPTRSPSPATDGPDLPDTGVGSPSLPVVGAIALCGLGTGLVAFGRRASRISG